MWNYPFTLHVRLNTGCKMGCQQMAYHNFLLICSGIAINHLQVVILSKSTFLPKFLDVTLHSPQSLELVLNKWRVTLYSKFCRDSLSYIAKEPALKVLEGLFPFIFSKYVSMVVYIGGYHRNCLDSTFYFNIATYKHNTSQWE